MVCSPVLLSFLSVERHEMSNFDRIPGCFGFLQRLFVLIPYSLFSSCFFFVFLTYLFTIWLDLAPSVHLLLLRTVSFRFVFLFDVDSGFLFILFIFLSPSAGQPALFPSCFSIPCLPLPAPFSSCIYLLVISSCSHVIVYSLLSVYTASFLQHTDSSVLICISLPIPQFIFLPDVFPQFLSL